MYKNYKVALDSTSDPCRMLLAESIGDHHAGTCLSPLVKTILCCNLPSDTKLQADIINKDLNILDLETLVESFPDSDDGSFEYFLQCANVIRPLVYELYENICNRPLPLIGLLEQHRHLYSWTSSPEVIERAMEILMTSSATCSSVHSILLLSSVIERSLGDVYLMKGRAPCPSMLKDLLVTPELAQIFGDETLRVLRCLIGPPTSLNIRNVLWHGFPAPGEIHPGFGFLLFSIICTLGKKLLSESAFRNIKHRTFVTFDEECIQLLQTKFQGDAFDCDKLKALIQESNFVYKPMQDFWQLGISLFAEKRYGESCVMLLPQLEHGMRRVFAAANDCPQRILTAENTTLFTTFDEILSPHMDETEMNKLYSALEHPYLMLLLDILKYPDGPRLRDRISHGEVDLSAVHPHTALHIIHICAALCVRFLPQQSTLWQTEYVQNIKQHALAYHTVFHPSSMASYQIHQLSISLHRWKNIPVPEEMEGSSWRCEADAERTSPTEEAAISWAQNHSSVEKQHIASIFNTKEEETDIVKLMLKPEVFDHYQSTMRKLLCPEQASSPHQDEIVRLVHRVFCVSVTVSEQVIEQGRAKHQSFSLKTMRSRQRNTYQRFLDSLQILWCGLRLLQLVCVTLLAETRLHNSNTSAIIKFLKGILQFCENLVTYTSMEKNKWEEAKNLTKETVSRIQHTVL